MEGLDNPERLDELRTTIQRKSALRAFYRRAYDRYRASIARAQPGGALLELGSGGGFVKEVIPSIITSDTLPYEGVDQVIDATHIPFPDASLSFIGMLNVFHHIADAEAFLSEASRCFVPGGRLLMVEPHRGLLSRFILRHFHHEPFDDAVREWRFVSNGPLSSANGALAWVVFVRDRDIFRTKYPRLRLISYTPHSPLQYWLAGGLRSWTLIPQRGTHAVCELDDWLGRKWPALGSFVDVEIVRT